MPTRSIRLSPEHDAYLDDVVGAGEYSDASEAVGEALRAFRARREEETLRLQHLRAAVAQGVAALDRGDYTEVGDDLELCLRPSGLAAM